MAISTNMDTGRMHKVGKGKITNGEKVVYKRIKAYLGKRALNIYVHQLGYNEFSISIFGPEFNHYGFWRAGTQIMYSNILRFIFNDIEISNMECSFYTIGGI